MAYSPMCDRKNTPFEKANIGFANFVVGPLFVAWSEVASTPLVTVITRMTLIILITLKPLIA